MVASKEEEGKKLFKQLTEDEEKLKQYHDETAPKEVQHKTQKGYKSNGRIKRDSPFQHLVCAVKLGSFCSVRSGFFFFVVLLSFFRNSNVILCSRRKTGALMIQH